MITSWSIIFFLREVTLLKFDIVNYHKILPLVKFDSVNYHKILTSVLTFHYPIFYNATAFLSFFTKICFPNSV